MRYKGEIYDSKLEVAWAYTLDKYGFDSWPHPGRIQLKNGSEWHPDFRVGDVLAEVKPWAGESVDRLWKPKAAADEHQLPVLIFRPGVVPDDPDIEDAGLDWESCDDQTWVIVRSSGGTAKFVPETELGDEVDRRYVHYSASMVLSRGDVTGLVMAHWSEAKGATT